MKCTICACDNLKVVIAQDIKTKHEFEYLECSNCGVVFIAEMPNNYEQYYGSNYYSFNGKPNFINKLKFIKNGYTFKNENLVTNFINSVQPNSNIASLKRLKLKLNDSLLDVGCGVGNEVRLLKQLGYTNVLGVDPFIQKDIYFNESLLVHKNDIFSINKQFKFITLHHSFEHLFNPYEVLQKLKDILMPNGKIMIRIPLAQTFAFKKYGSKWVQFDAPRHTFLHTEKSIAIMCEKLGINIDEVIYDSSAFQFWGSDIVQKDIGIHTASKATIFLARLQSLIKGYGKLTKALNNQKKGDQAIFILSKK